MEKRKEKTNKQRAKTRRQLVLTVPMRVSFSVNVAAPATVFLHEDIAGVKGQTGRKDYAAQNPHRDEQKTHMDAREGLAAMVSRIL